MFFKNGCKLGSVIGRWTLAGMVALLAWGPVPAVASSIPPTKISIYISNGLVDTYHAHVRIRLSFGASVERPSGSLGTVDVYMGAITPDKRIFSWVPDAGGPRLTEGLAPILQGVTALSFNTSMLLGRDAHYTFSGGEVTGMYLVFTLVAPPGASISDTGGWYDAVMVPLIFRP